MTPDLRDLSDVELADEIIAAAKAFVDVNHQSDIWRACRYRLVAALTEHDRRNDKEA